jgi:hypothetical protein
MHYLTQTLFDFNNANYKETGIPNQAGKELPIRYNLNPDRCFSSPHSNTT